MTANRQDDNCVSIHFPIWAKVAGVILIVGAAIGPATVHYQVRTLGEEIMRVKIQIDRDSETRARLAEQSRRLDALDKAQARAREEAKAIAEALNRIEQRTKVVVEKLPEIAPTK